MPRVENTGANVTAWHNAANGEGSSTFDVCRECNKKLEQNPHAFDEELVPYGDNEPDGDAGRSGDAAHPDYDDEEYDCTACNRRLTSKDNGTNCF